VVILHFADHDPSGLDMTGGLRGRLRTYAGAAGFGGAVRVEHRTLTIEQVRWLGIPPTRPSRRSQGPGLRGRARQHVLGAGRPAPGRAPADRSGGHLRALGPRGVGRGAGPDRAREAGHRAGHKGCGQGDPAGQGPADRPGEEPAGGREVGPGFRRFGGGGLGILPPRTGTPSRLPQQGRPVPRPATQPVPSPRRHWEPGLDPAPVAWDSGTPQTLGGGRASGSGRPPGGRGWDGRRASARPLYRGPAVPLSHRPEPGPALPSLVPLPEERGAGPRRGREPPDPGPARESGGPGGPARRDMPDPIPPIGVLISGNERRRWTPSFPPPPPPSQ
jgi:hypothetical protein